MLDQPIDSSNSVILDNIHINSNNNEEQAVEEESAEIKELTKCMKIIYFYFKL